MEAARFSSFQLGGKLGQTKPHVRKLCQASLMWLFPQHSTAARSAAGGAGGSLSLTKWMIFVTAVSHPCEKKISGLVFKAIPYLCLLDSFGLSCLQQPLETWVCSGLQDALRGQLAQNCWGQRAPCWSVAFWSLDLIHWRFLFVVYVCVCVCLTHPMNERTVTCFGKDTSKIWIKI